VTFLYSANLFVAFSVLQSMPSASVIVKVLLLVTPGIAYVAIYRGYFQTINHRRAEMERAIRATSDNRDSESTQDIATELLSELGLFYGLRNYFSGLAMNVFVSTILVYAAMARAHVVQWPADLSLAASQISTAAIAAAAGAFVANLIELVDKARLRELNASAFQYAWVKSVGCTAAGALVGVTMKEGFDLWLAFGIGVIPVGIVIDATSGKAREVLGIKPNSIPAQPPDLHHLQGMTEPVQHKLFDQGISSCEQLAYASPVKLLARTNLEWLTILDFIDQALLYQYVQEKVSGLRILGIRGAIQVASLALELHDRNERTLLEARAALSRVAVALGFDEPTACYLLRTIAEDLTVKRLAKLVGIDLGRVDRSEAVEINSARQAA
jgi:hypothetical protein